MAAILPPTTFDCTQYKDYNLVFTLPTVQPANGYLLRWKVSTRQSGWDFEQRIDKLLTGIIPIRVPECFNIIGELLLYCSVDSIGNPVYSIPKEFTILATATYTATVSLANCTLGVANFNVSGKPGQSIKIRLNFSATFQHDNTNGSCAWLTGEISDTSSTVYAISSAVTNVTSVQTISPEIIVVIPTTGNTTLQTKSFIHNAQLFGPVTSTVQIISVDNTPVTSAGVLSCVGNQQSLGCAPNNG